VIWVEDAQANVETFQTSTVFLHTQMLMRMVTLLNTVVSVYFIGSRLILGAHVVAQNTDPNPQSNQTADRYAE
jgi:hypothetical protein